MNIQVGYTVIVSLSLFSEPGGCTNIQVEYTIIVSPSSRPTTTSDGGYRFLWTILFLASPIKPPWSLRPTDRSFPITDCVFSSDSSASSLVKKCPSSSHHPFLMEAFPLRIVFSLQNYKIRSLRPPSSSLVLDCYSSANNSVRHRPIREGVTI